MSHPVRLEPPIEEMKRPLGLSRGGRPVAMRPAGDTGDETSSLRSWVLGS
jgi:hypothetical protein